MTAMAVVRGISFHGFLRSVKPTRTKLAPPRGFSVQAEGRTSDRLLLKRDGKPLIAPCPCLRGPRAMGATVHHLTLAIASMIPA